LQFIKGAILGAEKINIVNIKNIVVRADTGISGGLFLFEEIRNLNM
jgi:hypothetical protein